MRRPKARGLGDVIGERTIRAAALAAEYRDQRDEAIRQRDELRAILAPLLEQPMRAEKRGWVECIFPGCGLVAEANRPDMWLRHHDDACPVRHRDTLLGRDRAPAPPAGGAT